MKAVTALFQKYLYWLIMLSVVFISMCTHSVANVPTVIKYHSYGTKGSNYAPSEKNPFYATVKKGDTLYELAKSYNTNIRELIDLNDLTPPYHLRVGQRIKMPKPLYHVVQQQDTLYSISRSYEIDLSRLIKANNLQQPYTIFPGQKLRMPSKNDMPTESEYNVASNNTVKSTSKVEPVKANPQYAVQSKALDNTNALAVKKADVAGNYPVPTPKSQPSGSTVSEVIASRGRNVKFHWPLRGRVTSSFGPKKGGLYNDGINISAPRGSAIKAAADGKVVYSGNELKGYGNLLLVRHNNGFLTAYAHTQRNLVKKGDFVKQGQVIGYVGATGHVKSPQLHFSIRRGRKAFDPEKFLARSYSMR